MVQDYHYKGDFLFILGTFLPSALLAFAGYCTKKLINCISESKAVNLGDLVELIRRNKELKEVEII